MPNSDGKTVRIGCGSGFAMDRIEPGLALAESGMVDYLGFDALAERTIAMAHLRRRDDPEHGYDTRLASIVTKYAPHVANGLKLVGNFGGANVKAGAELIAHGFREAGHCGIRIASIHGDDIHDRLHEIDPLIPDLGQRVSELGDKVVSANAYIGCEQIVKALGEGAQVCIGGRLSDPSVFAGPICHEMGWSMSDYDKLAHATLVGHLLECSTQVTGGYFADPPYRTVPGIIEGLPFPYAEVGAQEAVITKLPGTGGLVDERTIASQVSYEVHDPAAYATPDVFADFTQVTCDVIGQDRVRVRGARGNGKPDQAKVLVGVDCGWRVTAEISYAGPGCLERSELMRDIMQHRIEGLGGGVIDSRIDFLGINSIAGDYLQARNSAEPVELRVRVAARCRTRMAAEQISLDVERMFLEGPAGGGGVSRNVQPLLGIYPAYVPAAFVQTSLSYLES